jgi:diguanylate cyclase (GGDEF)-like protein
MLLSLFLPNGLLVIAVGVILQKGVLGTEATQMLASIFPVVVAGVGILLGWRFNRSRLVFAIIVLALADGALRYFGPVSAKSSNLGLVIYNIVTLLLPLNLAVISLVEERGILTPRGVWRLCLILAQPLAVLAVYHYRQAEIVAYFDYTSLELPLLGKTGLTQPNLMAFGLAFFVIVLRFVRNRSQIEVGFFWALTATLLAVIMPGPKHFVTIYLATAGLVLVISVIETSYSMAFRDELTGLPARRALNEDMLKLGSTYTIAMLDIDFFKKFNDRYGHDVGDQVLRMVASKFARVTGGGKPFRYGGEEFTVIFPGKMVDECIPHLERLRKAVEVSKFTLRSRKRPRKKPDKPKKVKGSIRKVAVTISIGVADCSEKQTSPHQVIKAADKALYRAKKAGRNRVST